MVLTGDYYNPFFSSLQVSAVKEQVSQVPFIGGVLYCLTIIRFIEVNPTVSLDVIAKHCEFISWLRHEYTVQLIPQAIACACSV